MAGTETDQGTAIIAVGILGAKAAETHKEKKDDLAETDRKGNNAIAVNPMMN